MKAEELLALALSEGRVVQGSDVNRRSFPEGVRTHLGDGRGLAWVVPDALKAQALFAVDAEIVAPVRRSLVRYGVSDPVEFASAWTRAEVWAKLFDVPIITWLSRHGLTEPDEVRTGRDSVSIAWRTVREGDTIMTFGVRNPGVVGGDV